jgi:transposase
MKDIELENSVITIHSRGWSIRHISEQFGISRGRVRRILKHNREKREKQNTREQQPQKRTSKLDAYKEHVQTLLEAHKDITNERIFEILQEKGYQGKITILRDYLVKVRGKKPAEPIVCVETKPGQRGSHDWSEYYIEFTDSSTPEKIILFSFILNYSRRQYIERVEDKTQTTLLNCLINTFIYFDGVPRQVKSDNQKTCVDKWESGRPVFNAKYLEFATHYRFEPLAIHPGKPRENLKIERPFYYLETNFLNGRKFKDKQDLTEQLGQWLREYNDQRVHRTTKQKPIDLYQEEMPALQSLPEAHFDTSHFEYRIVNNQSAVEWDGFYYMVPREYLFETCPARATTRELIIYNPGYTEIARYPLADKSRKDKYVGRHRQESLSKSASPTKEVIHRLNQLSPHMQEYIDQLKKNKPETYRHHLRRLLSFKVNYHVQDIILAVKRALKYKIYDSSSIESFLAVNASKKDEIKLFPNNKKYEN